MFKAIAYGPSPKNPFEEVVIGVSQPSWSWLYTVGWGGSFRDPDGLLKNRVEYFCDCDYAEELGAWRLMPGWEVCALCEEDEPNHSLVPGRIVTPPFQQPESD